MRPFYNLGAELAAAGGLVGFVGLSSGKWSFASILLAMTLLFLLGLAYEAACRSCRCLARALRGRRERAE